MKAMIHTRYGTPDVVQLAELDQPAPRANEVLVQVEAAGVNAADLLFLKGQPLFIRTETGLFKPKQPILGADVAGRVAAVGAEVTRFQVGDAVFGDLSGWGRGAFAEFVAVPQEALALKPAEISFEQAAAVPLAAVTALQGLRDKGRLQAGEQVLINGASGGVGTFAVQIANALGAEVSAVVSTTKVDQTRALGATHVIDYTQTDFVQAGQRYDLIFDTVANRSVAEIREVLKPGGRFVTTGFLPELALMGKWLSRSAEIELSNMMAEPNAEDLAFLAEMLADGRLTPLIDRQYALRDTAEALRYVGEGHARGKVVLTV